MRPGIALSRGKRISRADSWFPECKAVPQTPDQTDPAVGHVRSAGGGALERPRVHETLPGLPRPLHEDRRAALPKPSPLAPGSFRGPGQRPGLVPAQGRRHRPHAGAARRKDGQVGISPMHSVGTPLLWIGFLVFVLFMLAVD